jgi:hypothetical protein
MKVLCQQACRQVRSHLICVMQVVCFFSTIFLFFLWSTIFLLMMVLLMCAH